MMAEYLRNDFERVREFHFTFDHPVAEAPTLVSDKLGALRIRLIAEELAEYSEALFAGDLVEIADALGDLSYVVNGAALVHGIDLPSVVEEIHRSNMTKLGADGKPVRREDGKILKGPNYEPPNLRPILGLDSA